MTRYISIDPYLRIHISDHPSPLDVAEAEEGVHAFSLIAQVRRDLGWAILREVIARERRVSFGEEVTSYLLQATPSILQDPKKKGLLLKLMDAIASFTLELAAQTLEERREHHAGYAKPD